LHTGQPIDRIERNADRDNFLSGTRGGRLRLVDKVLTNRAETAA
jgi:ATP-dependent Clp protease protease subunit